VWEEAVRDLLTVIPDPFDEDPAEVLVAAGIATRRAFGRHYRIEPFLAASPETTRFMSEVLGVLAMVFDRLGLEGEEASVSFHTYASFTIGAVLFAAARRVAKEKLGIAGKPAQTARSRRAREEEDRSPVALTTRSTSPPPIPPATRSCSPPDCAA
jgi:hypothetical protein